MKEEFENFTLHDWTFEANNKNEVSSEFTIEGTKIGESSHTEGRNIVTDYYEFEFEIDTKGELKLKEN